MTAMARLMLLLLLVWADVTGGDVQKRIIGGQTCGQTERLYHVRLRPVTPGGSGRLCAGSLISDRWILTAAHCWPAGWTMYANISVHPGRGQEVQITRQEVYSDTNGRHDIMLLQLPQTPTQIHLIALPDCAHGPPPIQQGVLQHPQHPPSHAYVRYYEIMKLDHVSGGSDKPNTLQCVNITVVDCTRLRSIKQAERSPRLYQHWFCGQTPGVDTCPGDSGGGVVYQNQIYGVHCFTGDPKTACNEAAGFMDVCEYKQWILSTIA
ncbi:trypsin-3-like [Centroberyx gerrardi]